MQKLQFNRVDSHEVCTAVLEYWTKKRKELGKPLLRRYWPLTNVNDTNPNLVFRPRGKVIVGARGVSARTSTTACGRRTSRTRRCWSG